MIGNVPGSAVTVSKTFGSTAEPPLIDGSLLNVVPNQLYSVKVELMQTDLSSSSEYAAISLNGVSYGNCDGGNYCDGCCGWFDCNSQLSNNQITSSSSSISVRLVYSNAVQSSHSACTDSMSGQSGGGVARVILTPVGKIAEHVVMGRTFLDS